MKERVIWDGPLKPDFPTQTWLGLRQEFQSCNQRIILLFIRHRAQNNTFTLLERKYMYKYIYIFFYTSNSKAQFPLLSLPESCFPKTLPLKLHAKLPAKLLNQTSPLSSLWEEGEEHSQWGICRDNLARKHLLLTTLSALPFWFKRLLVNQTNNYMFHGV